MVILLLLIGTDFAVCLIMRNISLRKKY